MAPPRRRPGAARSLFRYAAIQDAVRRTRRRHRRRKLHTPANSGPTASSAGAISQQGDISEGARNMRQEHAFEKLPEDIIHRIHSLLPIQDAACAACVCRGFLRSWKCYSNLILNDHTLRLTNIKVDKRKPYFIKKVDKILKNHYGNGVKVETFKLYLINCSNIKASYLDRWLQITVNSGIKKLDLEMPLEMKKNYSFPCSVLSDEAAASSIQSIRLLLCAFHPTPTLGCLIRLKKLELSLVHITKEGLQHLLSKSSALEELMILECGGIICLKIPSTLQQLKSLRVTHCRMLQVIQIDAPNLCFFQYDKALLEISVQNSSQLKHVYLSSICMSGILSYARATLPSIAQNVESLTLRGCSENANTPMLLSKLPHLKKLEIGLLGLFGRVSPSYDALSLVSFLDASPVLDSFILRLEWEAMMDDPVVGDDDEYPRRKLDCRHNLLRQVTITGFCAAKSLVELTVHILQSTPSLERLTLDTTCGYDRKFGTIDECPGPRKIGQCWPMSNRAIMEARRGVEAAGRYIVGRVPSAVQFEVLEPCSRCHTVNQ